MNALKLRIPPVVIWLLHAAAMWGVGMLFPDATFLSGVTVWISWPLAGIGGILGVLGIYEFAKAKTTVNPHRPDRSARLVTTGIYRTTRNPMYVGLLFLLVAWGFELGHLSSFALLPLFVWTMNTLQIKPEETILREKFGDEFDAYAARTRRWV
ncbi:MAG: methyltransferase family protein [Bacteroidota bacterium]